MTRSTSLSKSNRSPEVYYSFDAPIWLREDSLTYDTIAEPLQKQWKPPEVYYSCHVRVWQMHLCASVCGDFKVSVNPVLLASSTHRGYLLLISLRGSILANLIYAKLIIKWKFRKSLTITSPLLPTSG